MVKAPNIYWSAFTQTDLQVRPSVLSGRVTYRTDRVSYQDVCPTGQTECHIRTCDLQVRPSVLSGRVTYWSDQLSYQDVWPTGQTKCPIRTCDLQVRPSVLSGRVTYWSDQVSYQDVWPTGQTKCPIRTCDIQVRGSVSSANVMVGLFSPPTELVTKTFLMFVLVDLNGHFSRSLVKLAHFYSSTLTSAEITAEIVIFVVVHC